MVDNCEFCQIVRGDAPADVLWESSSVMAFTPVNPATVGHTLVVPKTHVPTFLDLDVPTSHDMAEAVVRVGRGLRKALTPDGMNAITSAGAAATQTVFHLHVHLVPRWHNDDVGDIWPRPNVWTERATDIAADDIRSAIESAN